MYLWGASEEKKKKRWKKKNEETENKKRKSYPPRKGNRVWKPFIRAAFELCDTHALHHVDRCRRIYTVAGAGT